MARPFRAGDDPGRRGCRAPAAAGRDSRRKIEGSGRIAAALEAGEPIRLLLVRRDAGTPELAALAERVRAAGVPVRAVSARSLWRLRDPAPDGAGGCDALALVGPEPRPDLEAVFAGGGAAWLLCGVAYPQNAGAAVRTAEVSGARGVVVDGVFDHLGRRRALRVAMRADLFVPVCFEPAARALDAAAAAGFRTLAIEDAGDRAPWEADLTGDVLFVAGGEERGVPGDVLDRADAVVRLPSAGFIPSYNLQAAVAAVALERLHQIDAHR